jgi:hypothetical protein
VRDAIDARSPEASVKNEAMTWAFENTRATLVAANRFCARRIVGWSQVGDTLKKASVSA